ncbi:MAG: alpha/beta hydrolase [Actinomycetia bacterium]|nr:alpha/beta hydrolase [Actinomycetes bacterium]
MDIVETPHGPIAMLIDSPKETTEPAILLAHGAGLGQHHPWMVGVRERLVSVGRTVGTFDYLYMHEGRKAPDRLPKLLDVHEAAARYLQGRVGKLVLAGKSMGGRVGSHLVAEERFDTVGLVYLGYPLVAMGKTEPRDTSHLEAISVAQLFISGTRDRMGPTEAIEKVAGAVPSGSVLLIDTGDHSLRPLKRTGRTIDDSLDTAVVAMESWINAGS